MDTKKKGKLQKRFIDLFRVLDSPVAAGQKIARTFFYGSRSFTQCLKATKPSHTRQNCLIGKKHF